MAGCVRRITQLLVMKEGMSMECLRRTRFQRIWLTFGQRGCFLPFVAVDLRSATALETELFALRG